MTTEQFDSFLETRQLRIWNVCTPYRSAIRLVRKQRDLNAYCDLKSELSLLATAQVPLWSYHKDEIPGVVITGELVDKFLSVKDALGGLVSWKKADSDLGLLDDMLTVDDFEADECGYGHTLDWELLDVGVLPDPVRAQYKNGITITFASELASWDVLSFLKKSDLDFGSIGYSSALRRVWDGLVRPQTPKSIRNAFLAVKGSAPLVSCACTYDNFLGTDVSLKRVARIEKFMKGHRASLVLKLGRTLNDVYRSVKVLDSLGNQGMVAIGAMENNKIVLDMPLDRVAVVEAVERYLAELGDDKLIEPIELPAHITRRAKIRELITAADFIVEGSTMRHCVAGYADTVKQGRSRIFHIELNGRHSTVEYRLKHTPNGPQLSQHRGVRNADVSEAEEQVSKALLKYLRFRYFVDSPVVAVRNEITYFVSRMRSKYRMFKWYKVDPQLKKLAKRWEVVVQFNTAYCPWIPLVPTQRAVKSVLGKVARLLERRRKVTWASSADEEIPF